MNKTRKILSLLLAVLMLSGTLSPLAYAESGDVVLPEDEVVEKHEESTVPTEEPLSEEPVKDPVTDEVKEEQPIKEIPAKRDEPIMPRSIIEPVAKTHTYRFLIGDYPEDPANPQTPHAKQIVKNGELLLEPANPEVPGKVFEGWHRLKEDNILEDEKIDFSQPIVVNDTKIVNVYAKFTNVYYVYFLYDGKVLKTKVVSPNGTVDDTDVPLVFSSNDVIFDYWKEVGVEGAFNFATPINKDTYLEAITKPGVTITFNSNGGSAILPVYRAQGEVLGAIENPTRQGYNFAGWVDGDGNVYGSDTPVNDSVTLIAQWTEATADYVVAHWQENANDNGYTFVESEVVNGPTNRPAAWTGKNYTGFQAGVVNDEKQIAPDGSTIVNVYYKRNIHTFTIERRPRGTNRWETVSAVQLKYGQSTAEAYNKAVRDYPEYTWYISRSSTTAYSEAPAMPNADLTVSGRYSGSTYTYTIRYIEYNTDPEVMIKDDYVFKSGTDSLRFTIEDGITIEGFTVMDMRYWGRLRPNAISRIPYTRNNYEITFHGNDGTGTFKSPRIPYQADISGQNPDGWNSGRTKTVEGITYYFSGWYLDPVFENAFDFAGKQMPAANFNLYAKWTQELYTVSLHKNLQKESEVVGTIDDIVPLTTIDEPDNPEPTNPAAFLGWFWYKDGRFVKFDFETPISENIDLYPVWDGQTARISYRANGGTGKVPEDSNHYLVGTLAGIQPAGELEKAGEVFLGWNTQADGNGEYFAPNSSILLNEDVVLYAQWGPVDTGTLITYIANGGLESDQEIRLPNNETHTIIDNPFTRPGYKFIGWNTDPNGTGVAYDVGTEVTVDRLNEETANNLYAQWERIVTDVVARKIWENGNIDDHTAVTLELWREYEGGPEGGERVDNPAYSEADLVYTWKDVPVYNEDGVLYSYFVKEPNVPDNYTVSIEQDETNNYYFEVTNSYVPPQTDENVIGTKVWVNGPAERPEVMFELWRKNGDAGEGVKIAEATLVDPKTNKVDFGKQLKTDINGVEYEYYVLEPQVPENYDKAEEGMMVTNSYVPPQTDENVIGTKVWVNGPAERPEVKFELWRKNGTAGEGEKVVEATLVDPKTNTVDFGKQLKTDINGVEYEYYVLEPQVPENYDKAEEGMMVTNTYRSPQGSITITKKWVGGPKDKPAIKLQLYREGKKFGEMVELKGIDTYTWDKLDINDKDGKPYIYEVVEEDVPENYKVSYSKDGLTITNTWVGPKEPEKPEKPKLPSTGSVNMGWMLFAGLALLGGGITLSRRKK